MIEISKDTHIPTDAEVRDGDAEAVITLDDLKTPVRIELSQPTTIGGEEITHVTLQPPTTKQLKAMQKNKNVSQAIELFIVQLMQDFSPDDTDQFLPRDYNRIQQVALNFL